MNLKNTFYLWFALLAFSGCSPKPDAPASAEPSSATDTLNIIATTGQINAALVKLTEGTNTNIQLFCGPGVDPHSFAASTSDVQAMLDADLIVYNGFHLEAKLDEYLHGKFQDKAWSMASAFPEEQRIDWLEDGVADPNAPFDPHIWNHLPGWTKCVDGLAVKLGQVSPENAAAFNENAARYIDEINATHDWAKTKLEKLPAEQRTIVSAHDAFNYFAKVYDMDTLAILGIGNDPEADIKTMREAAATICDRKIPAIFMESITNPKISQALQEACQARDWKVELVSQPLYSDDLGESAPQNTFLGAFKSNVEVVFGALSQ